MFYKHKCNKIIELIHKAIEINKGKGNQEGRVR